MAETTDTAAMLKEFQRLNSELAGVDEKIAKRDSLREQLAGAFNVTVEGFDAMVSAFMEALPSTPASRAASTGRGRRSGANSKPATVPEDRRKAITDALSDGQLSKPELAEKVGVSEATIGKALDAMVSDGTLTMEKEEKSEGRRGAPRKLYMTA
jgi:hypothetical protein